MFGRLVTIKLKVDSVEELARIYQNAIIPLLRKQNGFLDESLHIATCGSEAIAKTSWATKEDAKVYERLWRAEILIALANVVEGRPMMEGFECDGSTFQNALAKAA
ncbi:MAG TPA: hypothetical protein VLE19_00625 [Pyrinomonadaceae bacterium]|nr:hypothetical protein [Pyrinomonadaceae bacterium]